MDDRDTLATVAALEREGLEFYSRASRVVADPRARSLFKGLADAKESQIKFLTGEAAGSQHLEGGPTAPPAIYTSAAFEPLVCFVCGEEIKGSQIPEECPSCGASGYSFEVDMDQDQALRLAAEKERRALDYVDHASRKVGDAHLRETLLRVAEMEKATLSVLHVRPRASDR
jgi:rubrerythrin